MAVFLISNLEYTMNIESHTIKNRIDDFGVAHSSLAIYDGLHTPVSDDVLSLSSEHTDQIESFARAALEAYGPLNDRPERTLAHELHGIPCLVGRVDCTIVDGTIVPYELEDSPSGIGIADLLIQRADGTGIAHQVRQHFVDSVGEVPFVLVSGSRNHGTDDSLVFGDRYFYEKGDYSIPKAVQNNPVIVKAIPGSEISRAPYAHLQNRTLTPLETEGDKTYALRTGIAAAVRRPENLLRDESGSIRSQVLKARIGSMAMGVCAYLTPDDRKHYGAKGVTASKLERKLEEFCSEAEGVCLTQEFAPPIQTNNASVAGNLILRVFVLSSRNKAGELSVRSIGGCYVSRPDIIVHGASNAVGGAIVLN